jgi:hypothetical protein
MAARSAPATIARSECIALLEIGRSNRQNIYCGSNAYYDLPLKSAFYCLEPVLVASCLRRPGVEIEVCF